MSKLVVVELFRAHLEQIKVATTKYKKWIPPPRGSSDEAFHLRVKHIEKLLERCKYISIILTLGHILSKNALVL